MMDISAVVGFLTIGVLLTLVGLLIVAIARAVAHGLPASQVVEYLPPPTGSIFEHGLAVRADRRVLTAALIDLAVRGRVRVLATGHRSRAVAVEVLPGAQLSPEERYFLSSFRPDRMKPRQQRRYVRALGEIGVAAPHPESMPDVIFLRGRGAFRSYRRRRLTEFFDATRERMTEDGFTRRTANSVHLVLLSLLFLAVLALGLVLMLGAFVNGEWLGALPILVDIALVFWVLTLAPPPLLRFTDQGQQLRRHLSGLRAYMRLAEQDRLRMLQSPEGALRTPAGALTPGGVALGLQPQPTAGDPVAQSALDRFVLIERLLPYAILFRQEREWQREFERLGGAVDISQNMRTLGSTLQGVVVVLQALVIVAQILRLIVGVLSLFGRR